MNNEKVVDKVIEKVGEAAPHISSGLMHRREYVGGENPSEEKQREADVWANELLKEKITSIDGVGEYASEEEHEITDCGEGVSVAIDPLDGSSNIPTNNLLGTIVGIYEEKLPCKGENLISAFYILYGPLTTLTVARDGAVDEFIIEERKGDKVELYKSNENIQIEGKKVYGFGGNKGWSKEFRELENSVSRRLKLRYGGAMVGDFNQMIHHGGVFGYPAKEDSENGKYRTIFEGNPMAYIAEKAGGKSTNGQKSILQTQADKLHERTPFIAGQEDLVEEISKVM